MVVWISKCPHSPTLVILLRLNLDYFLDAYLRWNLTSAISFSRCITQPLSNPLETLECPRRTHWLTIPSTSLFSSNIRIPCTSLRVSSVTTCQSLCISQGVQITRDPRSTLLPCYPCFLGAHFKNLVTSSKGPTSKHKLVFYFIKHLSFEHGQSFSVWF